MNLQERNRRVSCRRIDLGVEPLERRTVLSTLLVPQAYGSLAAAFGAAHSGDVVKLTASISDDNSQKEVLPDGVTFDGSGNTVTFTNAGGGLDANGTAGTIENVNIGASVTLNGPVIEEQNAPAAGFTLANVTIQNVTANASMIDLQDGYVTVSNVQLIGNTDPQGGIFNMNLAEPTDLKNGDRFTINGVTANNNTAGSVNDSWETCVVGADLASVSHLTISGITVEGNKIYGNGALSITGGYGTPDVPISNGTIENNVAYQVEGSGNGGTQHLYSGLVAGLEVYPGITIDATNTVITNNTAANLANTAATIAGVTVINGITTNPTQDIGGGGTLNISPAPATQTSTPAPTSTTSAAPTARVDLAVRATTVSVKKHGHLVVLHQTTAVHPGHILVRQITVGRPDVTVRIVSPGGKTVTTPLVLGEVVTVSYGTGQTKKLNRFEAAVGS